MVSRRGIAPTYHIYKCGKKPIDPNFQQDIQSGALGCRWICWLGSFPNIIYLQMMGHMEYWVYMTIGGGVKRYFIFTPTWGDEPQLTTIIF